MTTALYIACRYALVANVIYTLAISNKLQTLRVSNPNTRAHPEFLMTFGRSSTSSTTLDFILATYTYENSCNAGYQLCASLSIIGRAAILSKSLLTSHFSLRPKLNYASTSLYKAVWGARTYAVFNSNKWVLALFASLGLTVFILGAVSRQIIKLERRY